MRAAAESGVVGSDALMERPLQSVRPAPRTLAPYATHPELSRGRRLAEPASATRTPFQRDRDRIVHSSAFRRLTHKTQVFVTTDGDHYRTRLTHSLEVAQIAGSIARVMALDEDLAEALALSHDFGHTPFGHEGEGVLDRLMAAHGGFDHNAQAYRIVTRLERRYAHFDGLNLTYDAGGAGEAQRPAGGGRAHPLPRRSRAERP
jgi:dGTPase